MVYFPEKVTTNLPIIAYLSGLGERGNDYVDEYSKHYFLQSFVDGINALGDNAKHAVAQKKLIIL